jgi:hypothetical protein
MQKKLGFLACAIMALLSFSNAYAQSSHDAASGADPDLPEEGESDFSIGALGGNFAMRFRGHLQQNNFVSYNTSQKKFDTDIKINRARFSILGHAFNPRLTYLFQTGFESDPKGKDDIKYYAPSSHYLRDYFFNVNCNDRHFQFRIGQFRTPFSRQQLISTSQMQFYDQSRANNEFQLTDSGRDVGIMFHNGFKNPFEWAFAAISNGVVLRVGYNYNDIDGYDFADFPGRDFRIAIAANGFLHTDYKSATLDDVRGGADFVAKVQGFSTNGAFYYQWLKRATLGTEAVQNLGGGLDFGYLIDKRIEPVLRGSWVKKAGDVNPHELEILAGLNYYIYGHHLKAQAYAGANLDTKDIRKWLGGVQFQFAI